MDAVLSAIGQGAISGREFHYFLGWSSALACFLISYFTARHVRSNARLFTVMALFAGAWVLIMAAIQSRSRLPDLTALPDRAADVASFLMVYTGSVLAREGPPAPTIELAQRWLQMAGLWLLFLLVLPSQLPLKLPLTPEQIDLALGELLGCAGFLALVVGSRAVASPRLFWPLLGTVLFYQCLSLARTCELWMLPVGAIRPAMRPEYVYAYLIARFLLTGLLASIVVRQHAKAGRAGAGASAAAMMPAGTVPG
jgi:hypothetical protein